MGIDLKTVSHIAELSKLKLSQEELKKLTKELSKIIDYINKLRELKLEKLKELELTSLRLREDKPSQTLSKESALFNAPIKERDYFVVPKIV
ncbi:Asp-tRNA(Asn)/Glu-tRNA(Gln) amidotransferase subunit GatC [candidate division WOR-3 bacterium]|nr:Asp-tRNA(Asn)/Glu-tRNA(Gln) amidotransferase subunit GatC [candidate division WOR-3 bacterium]